MWRSSLALAALLLAGCERYPTGGDIRVRRDMVDQPSFRAQEDPRPQAEGAVPVSGWEASLTRDQAEQRLVNPVPATPQALAEGAQLFGVYCTPCHGTAGRGDGPVSAKIGKVPSLAGDKYRKVKDGFLYHVIRNGSGIMPAYAESLAPGERWRVIHYVRRLQQP